MRKCAVFLLCAVLFSCMAGAALAQQVACPEARLLLTVPDPWKVVPLTGMDDPDLCLLLKGDDLTLSVYVSDANGFLPDAFQVFVGDETESGTVLFSGTEMTYVAGNCAEGEYRIYTWVDRKNQVQLYFLITGRPEPARRIIEDILSGLLFE